jgi:hypothetical protein
MVEHRAVEDAPNEHFHTQALAYELFEHASRLKILEKQAGSHRDDVPPGRRHTHQLVKALARIRFDEEHPATGIREHGAQQRGHEGFPDASFARNDDQLPAHQLRDGLREYGHV